MPDVQGQSADTTEDFNTEMSRYVPAQEVANNVESTNAQMQKIQNPDWVICMCSECGSEVPEEKAARNSFVQGGASMPCPYCGAPCVLVLGELRDKVLAQISARRGAL